MLPRMAIFLSTLSLISKLTAASEIIDEPVQVYDFGGAYITDIAFQPDGNRFMIGKYSENEAFVRSIDVETAQVLFSIPIEHSARFSGFSSGGSKVLVLSSSHSKPPNDTPDGAAFLVDLETGAILHRFEHSAITLCATFSPDGSSIVTGGGDFIESDDMATATIKFWNSNTGVLERTIVSQSPRELENLGEFVYSILFSPDNNFLLYVHYEPYNSGYPYYMMFHRSYSIALRPDTWEIVDFFSDFNAFSVFSPDGKYFVSRNGEQVSVYNYPDGIHVSDFNPHSGRYELSPDSRFIAADSQDGLPSRDTNIWELKTGVLTAILGNEIEDADSRSWSPDGKWLLTSVFKDSVRLWDVSSITQPAGVEEWEEMGEK